MNSPRLVERLATRAVATPAMTGRWVALALLVLSSVAMAQESPLADFVVGSYVLIGRSIESDDTYSGRIEIYRAADGLKIRRTLHGVVTAGDAAIETVLGGEAQVLRLRFTDNAERFEETCLVQGDLDNAARISCYLYKPGQRTAKPGLEALFIEPPAR